MDLIYWAIIGLGAFIAIWMLFVAPAERRHHERKLALLQKKIDKRQPHQDEQRNDSTMEQNSEIKDS